MIPWLGSLGLPWAVRANPRRPAGYMRPKFWVVRRVLFLLFNLAMAIAVLRLQCACYRSAAERWLCPTPESP